MRSFARYVVAGAALAGSMSCSGFRSAPKEVPDIAAAWPISPGGRQIPRGEGFGVTLPKGWRVGRERGVLVVASDRVDGSRSTIALRSAPLVDGARTRTADTVLPAVKAGLADLPELKITADEKVTRADGLAGSELAYSFRPHGHGGAQYERRQVTLLGKGRVFHIIHTGRRGALDRTDSEFRAVVASLTEES